ncbi:MAG: hypothetical protein H6565_02760 [Lewinellaceae bacterium]|nr:hypothetical protein [Lewinellaceae bacterium]
MNKPFLIAAVVGLIAMLISTFVSAPLNGIDFHCQPGFSKPILALEFAGSVQTFQAVFGADDLEKKRTAVLISLERDFVFILAYVAFLAAFAYALLKGRGKWLFLSPVLLAVGIGIADLLENDALRNLTLHLESGYGAFDTVIARRLFFATWTKWLGFAVYFSALLPYLFRDERTGRVLGIATGMVCLMAVMALLRISWIEPYVLSIFILFPLSVGYCFLKIRNR